MNDGSAREFRPVVRAILGFALTCLAVLSVRADSVLNFSLPDRGAVSLATASGTNAAVVGYARIQPNAGSTTPAGLAIFGLRQGGVLVSEAGVPASPLIRSGRIYAEVNGPINTGVAIANPNGQQAALTFFFTDSNGTDSQQATTTIGPNQQIAAFLDQPPFNVRGSLIGAMTFSSTVPVSVIALRGLTNERSEFLITTLPVIDTSGQSFSTVVFPHFADGGGWSTQVVLVNAGDNPISGTVQFFSQGTSFAAGQPASLTVNGQAGASFAYTVARRSSIRLRTAGLPPTANAGSIRIQPGSGQPAPSGLVIFSFRSDNVTVSEAGIPVSRNGRAYRLYVEASDPTAAILSGLAVANPSASPITVQFELTTVSGESTGLTGTETISGNGQIAKFLNQIQGLQSVPLPFKGVLRVSTTSVSGISLVGLRSRVNERGSFLITTTPATDEAVAASTAELVFPHILNDGGYTTQFVLYSGSVGQSSSGVIRMVRQSGQTLDLKMASISDLSVTQTTSPTAVSLGDNLTYSVVVSNNGPAAATNVILSDTLPAGITLMGTTASQGACDPAVASSFICRIGAIAVGQNATVLVNVRVDSEATLTNTVRVTSNEDDGVSGNNRSSFTALLRTVADLAVSQSGPPSCASGVNCNAVNFVITVTNNGPGTAFAVTLADTLPVDPPSGVTVGAIASLRPGQGTCAPSSNRFTCNLGSLAKGAATFVVATMEIDSTAIGRTVINQATVSTDSTDTDTGNNSSNQPLVVTPTFPEIDLTLSATVPVSVNLNSDLRIQITAGNNGNSAVSTATKVKVTVAFSSPVQVVSPGSGVESHVVQGNNVILTLGTMRPQTVKTFTLVVRATARGALNSTISVESSDPREQEQDSTDNGPLVFTTSVN